jgi:PAS domain S-box-containing protein
MADQLGSSGEQDAEARLTSAERERQRTESHLHQSEQWLRMLIDSAEDYAIFSIDLDRKITTWNKGAENLFGYVTDEILGEDFAIIFTPEDRADAAPEEEVGRALRDNYSPDQRWHVRKDGSRFFVHGSVRPLRDREGHVHGLLKVAHDVTQQKKAEELESRFRAFFQSAPGMMVVLRPEDYRIEAASDAYLRATMTARESIVGQPIFEVFPGDPKDPLATGARNLHASLDRVKDHRRTEVMPVQYYPIQRPAHEGGGFEDRWWSPINSPVLGPHGELLSIIHRVEDVTLFVRELQAARLAAAEPPLADPRLQQMAAEVIARGQEIQRANEELRQSEERFRLMVNEIKDYAIYMLDPEGRIITWNAGAERIKGYSAQEIIGQPCSKLYPPEDIAANKVQHDLQAAIEQGQYSEEGWRVRRDGSRFLARVTLVPVRDTQGTLRGFTKVTQDITASRAAEEELRRSRGQFEAVFQIMRDGIVVSDPAGNIILCNPAQARLAGLPSVEAMLKNVSEFAGVFEFREADGRIVPFEQWPLSKVLRGETLIDWQLHGRGRDTGREWFFDFSGAPVTDQQGRVVLAVLVTRDITEQKRMEGELRRAREHLEAAVAERTARLRETINELERFSYSLSHDMRAPLRAMRSFAELLHSGHHGRIEGQGNELLKRIITAATRLDELIEDVLSLSRLTREPVRVEAVDLETLLRQLINERPGLQPPQADVSISSPLLDVSGHKASLTQCFSNLLENAVKFVAPGVHPRVLIWTEPAGEKVRVCIQDNGIGIPHEYRDQIFGMFQRLHADEAYAGTGVGLAIVRRAVERMGGKVGVESQPGQGSTFWVELQRAKQGPPPQPP